MAKKAVSLLSTLNSPKAKMESFHTEGATLEVTLDRIKPRHEGDLRILDPDHVAALAESIAAIGLLEPIVTDARYRLLAGLHRLSSLKLVSALAKAGEGVLQKKEAVIPILQGFVGEDAKIPEPLLERIVAIDASSFERLHPGQRVPIRVMSFDSESEPNKALEAEIVENEKRRDFSKAEVERIVATLKEKGYVEVKGRPKAGAKPMMPALALVLGKSLRQAQRLLDSTRSAGESSKEEEQASSLPGLVRAINRSLAELESDRSAQAKAVITNLKELLENVQVLIKRKS